MLQQLWHALFARRSGKNGTHSPTEKKLQNRVCWNEPEFEPLMQRLQSLNLPQDTLRQRVAFDILVDPHTRKVWHVVMVEDGPAPLYGLEFYGEYLPSAEPTDTGVGVQ
jgi:hypothetical protein